MNSDFARAAGADVSVNGGTDLNGGTGLAAGAAGSSAGGAGSTGGGAGLVAGAAGAAGSSGGGAGSAGGPGPAGGGGSAGGARRFPGRVAVVTGGASGIGAAIAWRLASEGALVAVADLDAERASNVADEIGGAAVRLDVADVDSVRAGFAQIRDLLGPIELLVNNAGVDRFAFFVDTEPAEWDFVLGVNLRGTMACTHAVLAEMQQRRAGGIVNIASEAGRGGTIAGASYAAAKAGVIGFTKAIALEAARYYGVRCNAVAPGPVDTPLLTDATATAGALGAKLRQGMVDATALRRCGTVDEVAAAVAFIASDEASYLTGQTLAVGGGLSMW